MIKLWLNYDKIIVMIKYGETIEVGEGRNFGIPQDSMMYIWVFCGLPGCCFFSMDTCIMMLSLKC